MNITVEGTSFVEQNLNDILQYVGEFIRGRSDIS